jgi:hypothetical protein
MISTNLNFSAKHDHASAMLVDRNTVIDYADILVEYCRSNGIQLCNIDDSDFMSAVSILHDHGRVSLDPNDKRFYFWIAY